MPIEFRCPNCQRTLQTPDDSAGKRARCPQCSEIVNVPLTSESTPAAPVNPFAADAPQWSPIPNTNVNPYQVPQSEWESVKEADSRRPLIPTQVTFDELWERTKEQLTKHFWNIVVVSLIGTAISFVVSMVSAVFGGIAQGSGNRVAIIGVQVVQQILGLAIQAYVIPGVILVLMKLLKTGQFDVAQVFHGLPYMARALGYNLLMMLVTALVALPFASPALYFLISGQRQEAMLGAVGGVLLFMPVGMYLWLTFGMSIMFIVEQNSGVIEAMGLSRQYTAGNRLTMFLFSIVFFLLVFLFVIVTCFIGALANLGISQTFMIVYYLSITGYPFPKTAGAGQWS